MTVEEIEALDLEWAQKEILHPPDSFGWSPYPLGLFAPLLDAALAHSKGPRFLDVGSGIGTTLLLARQAGLDPEGVEQIEEFAVFADRLGFTTHRADVRGWDGYDGYDIVYVNHPLINTELEEPSAAGSDNRRARYPARVVRVIPDGRVHRVTTCGGDRRVDGHRPARRACGTVTSLSGEPGHADQEVSRR